MEQGADGGVGFVHDAGDFLGFELLEGAEEKSLAFGRGKAIDGCQGLVDLLGFAEGLVGGGGLGCEGSEEGLAGLIGAGAATSVEGEVPGDADQPGAEVADLGEGFLVLEDAEKGVLDDVFSFGAVPEEAVGYAEQGGAVEMDERGEVKRDRCRHRRLFPADLWPRPTQFPDHDALLPGLTAGGQERSTLFSGQAIQDKRFETSGGRWPFRGKHHLRKHSRWIQHQKPVVARTGPIYKFREGCSDPCGGDSMDARKRRLLYGLYLLATVQLTWCYLWLTRPYVSTRLYEQGLERMPFQGRLLMMLPMRLADGNAALRAVDRLIALSPFWFPRTGHPEVLVQAAIDVACVTATGVLTTQLYQASSRRHLLTYFIYPLVLVVWAMTYVLHTVQNFRFLYDLPSLAFFTGALYLIYTRRHPLWFVALFLVATINRETTLLLLPLYAIDRSVIGGRLRWKRLFAGRTMLVVLPLLAAWVGWEIFVRHHFAGNRSEFYPRLNWNVKSILVPQAWPQMLSACGYLLPFVVVMRRRIPDARLRAWLWLLPLWVVFMFSYGILVETRVFGELIPLVVCCAALITEELLAARMLAGQQEGMGRDAALEAVRRAA